MLATLAVEYALYPDPEVVVEIMDLWTRDSDGMVEEIVAQEVELVRRYRAGETKVLSALVGKVQQRSGGKTDGKVVRELLERLLTS